MLYTLSTHCRVIKCFDYCVLGGQHLNEEYLNFPRDFSARCPTILYICTRTGACTVSFGFEFVRFAEEVLLN